jgi:hypothetical protein
MANTAATDIGDSVAAEIINENMVSTAYAAVTWDRMVPKDEIQGSLTKSYPRLGKVTAAALTDGTDGTATAMTDTQVSVTVAEIGIGVALTDLARVGSSVKNIASVIANLLGRGYANKVEVDGLAEFADLTDSVSNTGAAMTEDMWFQAIYEIQANDAIGYMLAAILHPKQLFNLNAAIGGTTENNSALWGRTDFFQGVNPPDINGFATVIGGIPVFISTNVPTANANADVRGAIFVVGDDCPFKRVRGVLDGTVWDGRLEVERDASLRATEAWVTGATGVNTIAPDRGCSIVSDAP